MFLGHKPGSSYGVYVFPPSFLLTSIHVLSRQDLGKVPIGVSPFSYHSFSYDVAPLSASVHSLDGVTLISQTLLRYQRTSITPVELSAYPFKLYTFFI
jgi:hypothetical protein